MNFALCTKSKYRFKFMLSDEKNISQNMRSISLRTENDFLLIGLQLVPASVVWVATSLNSKRMMVAGVANQPRMIAQLKKIVMALLKLSTALVIQFH